MITTQSGCSRQIKNAPRSQQQNTPENLACELQNKGTETSTMNTVQSYSCTCSLKWTKAEVFMPVICNNMRSLQSTLSSERKPMLYNKTIACTNVETLECESSFSL